MSSTPPHAEFAGRWLMVTGASSGLGRAVAIELASRGASVVLVGRDGERLRQTAELMGNTEHRQVSLDLAAQLAQVPDMVAALRKDVGPIYGLCHAAGLSVTRPLASSAPETLQPQLLVNLVAGLELARCVSRRDTMSEDGGSLLFISSVYGQAGMPGQVGYCASKGGLAAAARAMAVELARRRIRVNCMSPGLVMTEMTRKAFEVLSAEQVGKIREAHPLGVGEPGDVARAAAFLLSPASSWITGVDLPVDGGYLAR